MSFGVWTRVVVPGNHRAPAAFLPGVERRLLHHPDDRHQRPVRADRLLHTALGARARRRRQLGRRRRRFQRDWRQQPVATTSARQQPGAADGDRARRAADSRQARRSQDAWYVADSLRLT